MLSTMSLAGRAPALLQHGRRIPLSPTIAARAFALGASNAFPRSQSRNSKAVGLRQKRSFTRTAIRSSAAAAQPAPNPKAYLESGVIKPHDIVDVKKVLVIGSGGLAIGQAGEFDYSGWSPRASCFYLSFLPPLHPSMSHTTTPTTATTHPSNPLA